jgi:hypothetical protein
MAEYTYTNHNVTNPNTLNDSLLAEGVTDANFILDVELVIDTATGTQTQCDDAVANAVDTGLLQAKTDKKAEYDARSTELALDGAESWQAGVYVPCSLDDFRAAEIAKLAYDNSPAKLNANTPYLVLDVDGNALITDLIADVNTIVSNMEDRIQYIYSSFLNGDGSKGRVGFFADIDAAATVAAVDALTDTRV